MPALNHLSTQPLPPAKGRFVKGQSGNPTGGQGSYMEFRALLRGEPASIAVGKLVEAATGGERWAVELVLAYSYGKPAQAITGEGGEGDARLVISWQKDE